jgi:hypothetical protein
MRVEFRPIHFLPHYTCAFPKATHTCTGMPVMHLADVTGRDLMGQNTFRANVNRDLEGRNISNIRHLLRSSMSARGSLSVMSAFRSLVSCANICHGEVPAVKCYNIFKVCRKKNFPLYLLHKTCS